MKLLSVTLHLKGAVNSPIQGLLMKRLHEFVGSTLISGVILVLPVYLCLLLLLKAMHSLSGLVRPVVTLLLHWFPAEKLLSVFTC